MKPQLTNTHRTIGGILALVFGLGVCLIEMPRPHAAQPQQKVLTWEKKRKLAFDKVCQHELEDKTAEEIDFYIDQHGEPNYGITCGRPVEETINGMKIKHYEDVRHDIWAIVPKQ